MGVGFAMEIEGYRYLSPGQRCKEKVVHTGRTIKCVRSCRGRLKHHLLSPIK